MFYGVPERENEDCENLIKALISEKLELSRAESIPFDRMHRVGLFSHLVAGLCHFVFSRRRRKNAMRKDEKRHAKRRNNAMRKDEKTKPATRKDEISARKDEKTPCEKTPFETLFLSSFRVASIRLFVFSPGVISAAKRRKDAMRKDEITLYEKTK